MNQHPTAGMGMVGQQNAAAGGMRNLRQDLFDQMMNHRQKGMQKGQSAGNRDRRYQTISAMLGAAGPMMGLLGGGSQGQPFDNQTINQVPQQMMAPPSYLPPEM